MKKLKSLFYPTVIIGNILFSSPVKITINSDNYQTIINQNIGQELANYYLEKKTINNTPNLTLENSFQVQDEFVKTITPTLGKLVGYKVGLTNKQSQNRFNVSTPITGILLEKMLLPNNTQIPVNFGSIPMMEGDLMVRVGNNDINQANTPEEILANLDTIIPFIELPDLVYAPEVKVDAPALIAINVGARLGIMGEEIPLNNQQDWLDKIDKINLTITDENNQEIAQGNSGFLLGNPLNVVLWLKNDLQSRGQQLKKGDLISLGTVTPIIPVKKEGKITAKYTGLIVNETVTISISFY
jgi:2-keto-4-pentenoate hydratase